LETSKEELQSLNEESATVNAELQARIDELSKSNDDMKNLLDSTEIAVVFLDSELRVRRFTPSATEIIPLTATDCGRPINHLASPLKDADLAEYGRRVLEDLALRETQIESQDGRCYVMRIRPYRTVANVIDGVVITFEDITDRKRADDKVRESEERYRVLFDNISEAVLVHPPTTERMPGKFTEVNQAACDLLGYSRRELQQFTVHDLSAPGQCETSGLFETVLREKRAAFQRVLVTKDGRRLVAAVRAHLFDLKGQPTIFSVVREATDGG
jgi:two-component system CheB/CheR fusion protein